MRFPQQLERWEDAPVDSWRHDWNLPRLHILEWTASTNDDVRALANERAPELTVVMAERQTAGRGQHGRDWQGAPGKSIHFSALLRPTETSALTAVPLRVGVAVAEELGAAARLTVGLKWPNDLVVSGRKLGGILCESSTGSQTAIVVGIGINVGHQPNDFSGDVHATATSLAILGARLPRPVVAEALCRALHRVAPVAALELSATELAAIERIDALNGRLVDVDGITAGRARGVTSKGALRVERDGEIIELHGGTVRATPDRDIVSVDDPHF